jgi:hypothetical protein
MTKKAVPVPKQPECWYFRDRQGNRFGPYRDERTIRDILSRYRVGQVFEPGNAYALIPLPLTEFVMEDAEYNPVCPGDWLAERNAKRRQARFTNYQKRYGSFIYRQGPVAGIHKSVWRYSRHSKYGRRVRDTGAVCPEDGEPPIRKRLQLRARDWDDFQLKTPRSWKYHRRHQWKA